MFSIVFFYMFEITDCFYLSISFRFMMNKYHTISPAVWYLTFSESWKKFISVICCCIFAKSQENKSLWTRNGIYQCKIQCKLKMKNRKKPLIEFLEIRTRKLFSVWCRYFILFGLNMIYFIILHGIHVHLCTSYIPWKPFETASLKQHLWNSITKRDFGEYYNVYPTTFCFVTEGEHITSTDGLSTTRIPHSAEYSTGIDMCMYIYLNNFTQP